MNRFTEGGRLKATHKNKINSKELFKNLNEIAKEKVNGQIHKNDNGRSQSGRRLNTRT